MAKQSAKLLVLKKPKNSHTTQKVRDSSKNNEE